MSDNGEQQVLEAKQEEDGSWWVQIDGEWLQIISEDGMVSLPEAGVVGEVNMDELEKALEFIPITIPQPLFYDQDANYDYAPRPGTTQEQAMEVVRECWLMTLAKILETRGEGSYEELLVKLQNGEIAEMEIDYPAPSQMSALGYVTRTAKIDLAKSLVFSFQTYNPGWLSTGGASYDTTTVGTGSTLRLRFNVSEEGQMKIVAFWIPRIDNPLLVRDLFSCGVRESLFYLAEGRVVHYPDPGSNFFDLFAINIGPNPTGEGEVTRKLNRVGDERNPIIHGQTANP